MLSTEKSKLHMESTQQVFGYYFEGVLSIIFVFP